METPGMKIQFDTLDYQTDAVNAAVNIFNGQMIKTSNFSLASDVAGLSQDETGTGNHVIINAEQMLKNVNQVQSSNQIAPSDNLFGNNKNFPQFNIEMETGTGKTFVYLKTILELYAKYGFLKFVIVVPSVAIREGVIKTFHITRDYFRRQYHGTIYDMFTFDSNNLSRVSDFASSTSIDVMVTTIQAFNKETNVMNREMDQLLGARPIDLIAETKPILIIDEPQSVDNTDLAKSAIASLRPSVGFRYSATHRDTSYPTIYRLTAVDAYDNQLVKQIEVAGIHVDEDGNRAHLKLISVTTSKRGLSAKIEVYKRTKKDADKVILNFRPGDDLYTKTKLQVYEQIGFIQDMDATPGNEAVYFSGNLEKITLESATLEDEEVKRSQIYKTIEEHLNKELQFAKSNLQIKVLSLFFLDKVENYRIYDSEGNAHLGKYARIFEEEYQRLIKQPRYAQLKDVGVPVEEIHDGYFSVDRKGTLKNTNGNTRADESTYEMIMRDKEGLLTRYDKSKGHTSKANKIRFIFSHSALKEGWDNPNVFQIATLIETKDTITKRQKIGRGLRIAVDEAGQRVPGFDVNTLTVMANESYQEFAEGLQKEYEADGAVFGLFDKTTFATLIVSHNEITDDINVLGKKKATQLFSELREKEYINKSGHATDRLRTAISDGRIDVSDEFKELEPQILKIAKSKVKSLKIRDANNKVQVKMIKEALPDDFLELWNKIKYKTTYHINFDSQLLIKDSVSGNPFLGGINDIETRKGTYLYSKSNIKLTNAGIVSEDDVESTVSFSYASHYQLPDIITYLQNETKLTRKTIVAILESVTNLDMFKNNPLSYMNQAAHIINAHKNQLIVDGIEYKRTDDYYEQKLFTTETLNAYLGNNGNALKANEDKAKTLYDYVVTDSTVELDFARQAELDNNVKFYIKLPDWFKIRTPLGPYNPDWAILYEEGDDQHLYFIVETKGDVSDEQLRPHERAKILSGEKHFKAIDTDIKFKRVTKEQEIRG